MSIKKLREQYENCHACPLHNQRQMVVHGSGNSSARLLFVGEGPGEEEDQEGLPFVGAAGRFFNMMLKNINLPRTEIWVTNVVLCRPLSIELENRVPTVEEMQACLPRLHREITLIDPLFIVLLGETATRALCPHLHGKFSKHVGNIDVVNIPLFEGFSARYAALIEWHPSYLLRVDAGWNNNGPAKRMTDDLRIVAKAVDFMGLLQEMPDEALQPYPPLPDRGVDVTILGEIEDA